MGNYIAHVCRLRVTSAGVDGSVDYQSIAGPAPEPADTGAGTAGSGLGVTADFGSCTAPKNLNLDRGKISASQEVAVGFC